MTNECEIPEWAIIAYLAIGMIFAILYLRKRLIEVKENNEGICCDYIDSFDIAKCFVFVLCFPFALFMEWYSNRYW